jgi:hypothetical protein
MHDDEAVFTAYRFCSHPMQVTAVPIEPGSQVAKMTYYRKGHHLPPGGTCPEMEADRAAA